MPAPFPERRRRSRHAKFNSTTATTRCWQLSFYPREILCGIAATADKYYQREAKAARKKSRGRVICIKSEASMIALQKGAQY
jgi:hypothetical protein